jgi:hypothetical protein
MNHNVLLVQRYRLGPKGYGWEEEENHIARCSSVCRPALPLSLMVLR